MKKEMWTKRCALLTVFLLLAGIFAACASPAPAGEAGAASSAAAGSTGSADAAPANKNPVTITFWHNFGSDKETPYFANTIMKMLKEKQPWLTVKVVAKGSDKYKESVITAIATRSQPDVARLDSSHVATLAAQKGALVELDTFADFLALKDQLQAAPMATCQYKGKYYALPLGTDCKAMVVNTKNLASIGLTEMPATLEELIAAAKEKSPGKFIMSVSSAGEYDILPWFWLLGGVLCDENFTKTTGYLDSAESVKAATELKKLHDDKVLTVKKEIDGTVDAWDGIKKTDYVAFLEGPWFFSANPTWKDLGLKPVPIPSYNGKTVSIVGGHDVIMFASSKNKDASFEFIKFLLSEEVQVNMGLNAGIFPTLKAASSNSGFADNEVWSVYLKQLESTKCRMPSPQQEEISKLIEKCFKQIITGEDTPQALLSSYAKQIDEQLAK